MDNLATVIERFSTHVSEEVSREEISTARWFSPRAGSSNKHPLSSPFHNENKEKLYNSNANTNTVCTPVSLIDKKFSKLDLSVNNLSSTGCDNPREYAQSNIDTARSDFYFTMDDEVALQEALDRSISHLNGIPCFLLQAYRSYDRKIQASEKLWKNVLKYVHNVSNTVPSSGNTNESNQIIKNEAPKELFDDLLVSIHICLVS